MCAERICLLHLGQTHRSAPTFTKKQLWLIIKLLDTIINVINARLILKHGIPLINVINARLIFKHGIPLINV